MDDKPIPLDRRLFEDIPLQHGIAAEVKDLFGVEIELEGKKLKTIDPNIAQYWGYHADGSLRLLKAADSAFEYVFLHPLNLDLTFKALEALFNFLNTPPAEVFPSYRTSVHVHVNCAAETYRTIYNFITLAIIFDELFVSQNGEHRIGNNFCLRAKDAQGQIGALVSSIKNCGSLVGINANNRYSSINFASLLKFGTVEFRSMECTTDYNRVVHWINTINQLKTAARQFANPREVIGYFSRNSAHEFLYFILGAQAFKYVKVENMERMLLDGMRLAQDFAYCSEWKPNGMADPQSISWIEQEPE